ncbi:108aa long hypothetical protein [Pyrococcus horikoshii OT3]|uniref:Uncharacterized protein n=1 Tax=Pyrococcus horikoshii (strain ATCC 700860 / DSM 12428 / JCM 9974 / NBRC 100139 / OT-3) TaxID=70601 RepID=O59087_PYRHO|nr:108aa long hypothetical protein [Pyrococcus horikoshii OT3]
MVRNKRSKGYLSNGGNSLGRIGRRVWAHIDTKSMVEACYQGGRDNRNGIWADQRSSPGGKDLWMGIQSKRSRILWNFRKMVQRSSSILHKLLHNLAGDNNSKPTNEAS